VYSLGVILFEMIAGQPPFAFEALGSAGPARAPLSFAECNLPMPVPSAVNDLVIGMLHPDAAQHGVNANRVVLLLDTLLGRPSVVPPALPAEPITSQHQSAPQPEPRVKTERPPLVQGPTPDAQPSAAQATPFWPVAEPSAPVSWPPLPRGFSGSSVPPPPVGYDAPPPSQYPSGPPVGVASGTYPPTGMAGDAPHGFAPADRSGDAADDDDTDFRPSLLGRLRRLFGKAKPGGF
jgi:hypothetical protein